MSPKLTSKSHVFNQRLSPEKHPIISYTQHHYGLHPTLNKHQRQSHSENQCPDSPFLTQLVDNKRNLCTVYIEFVSNTNYTRPTLASSLPKLITKKLHKNEKHKNMNRTCKNSRHSTPSSQNKYPVRTTTPGREGDTLHFFSTGLNTPIQFHATSSCPHKGTKNQLHHIPPPHSSATSPRPPLQYIYTTLHPQLHGSNSNTVTPAEQYTRTARGHPPKLRQRVQRSCSQDVFTSPQPLLKHYQHRIQKAQGPHCLH